VNDQDDSDDLLYPDRNLALELVRATEAAAMAAGRWVGRGDKNAADGAAVAAMRSIISTVQMAGTVVIGEGEKDNAPMLYNGEEVGDGTGAACDVAVDPIDGTRLTALGMPGAVAVLAVADRGSMFDPSALATIRRRLVRVLAPNDVALTLRPTGAPLAATDSEDGTLRGQRPRWGQTWWRAPADAPRPRTSVATGPGPLVERPAGQACPEPTSRRCSWPASTAAVSSWSSS